MLVAFHVLFFQGIRSSDGIDYVTVARNIAEGRGVTTTLVDPGLIPFVSTTRAGQPFIIQAPLWPEALGLWFKLTGASIPSAEFFTGLIFLVATVETWWLATLLAESMSAGYLALGLMLANPMLAGHSMAATTVPLQAAIFGAILLLLTFRPIWWRVYAVGAMLGLGMVAREDTIFLLVAVAVCWYSWARHDAAGKGVAGLGNWRDLIRLAGMASAAGALLLLGAFQETLRKYISIGAWDAPVLRETLLYQTPVGDSGWFWIYDHPSLHINPVQYFASHPDILGSKILFQLDVAFRQQTLPVLMSNVGWLFPVVLPWLLRGFGSRVLAWAVLGSIAVQALVSSILTEHFTYFLVYIPALSAIAAATAVSLAKRIVPEFRQGRYLAGALSALLAGYAVLPLPVNAFRLATGNNLQQGDFGAITPTNEQALATMITEHTPPDAVVACALSALMAWDTGRTIMEYSGLPQYRISDSEMWRTIDRHIQIDYIALTTMAGEQQSTKIMPGFDLVASTKTADMEAWLYRRGPSV
ncbi:MAG: hypothetical protein JOZ39_03785 [Chloroflexi bacterium]|nr:hypothetical protein [Chloroflexota bacterium]